MTKKTVWDLIDELEEASQELVESIVEDIRQDLRRVLDSYPTHVYGAYETCLTQRPAYTVSETDDKYRIVIDLPYVDQKTIRLRLVGRTLHVQAQTSREINGRCVVFEAKIRLDKPIDKEKSGARFTRGLLVVDLKKQKQVNIEVD